MRYLSLCSGIEAATVAWHPLGWKPVAFSEIAPFPSATLAQHYPDIPNLGDITRIDGTELRGEVDCIVGGTPCQAFSVAGLRQGLRDPRGNLCLAFLKLVHQVRPEVFIWENVPGTMSSNKGRDFGSFIGSVEELRYRGAWRVLDAQYFGLAQRRKRLFFVGCSPECGLDPRKILLESESLRGSPPPSREKEETVVAGIARSLGERGTKSHTELDGHGAYIPALAYGLRGQISPGYNTEEDTLLPFDELTTVRRLSPIECERLQGFPDNYTRIPWRGKDAKDCPDGLRYKALGNSMAVPVMRWLGEQIIKHKEERMTNKRQGSEVADLIFKALEDSQDRDPRGHLGCSIIGRECEREVWYMWRWAKAPDFPGRILRLFRRGHEEEPNAVKDLRAIGAEVHESDSTTGRQFKISGLGGHLGGSLDGAISKVPGFDSTWMVLEIKTAGSKPFAKLVKNGVELEKPEHFAQMQLYMRGTGMMKALYLAVCKDTDAIHTEVIDFDQVAANAAIAKARRVLESSQPPAKISDHPSWWKCKLCDHRPHCQGDQAPEVNCRTCVHATPEIDENRAGLWTCSKLEKGLTLAKQRVGCVEHLYIPGMVNFAEAIDADERAGWVEYKSEQGVFFKNSGEEYASLSDKQDTTGTPWSSPDIHALGAKVLTDDPLLESIRRNFGPTKLEID